jgi:hypothetical protein
VKQHAKQHVKQHAVEIVTFKHADHDWIVREEGALFDAVRSFYGRTVRPQRWH